MKNFFDRITEITNNEGINITTLEHKIGASQGVLSRAKRNNTSFTFAPLKLTYQNYLVKITLKMELTKQISDFFNQRGSKQRLRMLLALDLDVSFETISRWLDRDNEKLDSTKGRNALMKLTGLSNDELFNTPNF